MTGDRPVAPPPEISSALDGLVGWSIPTDTPDPVFGGVIPNGVSPSAFRIAARVLHTLFVRRFPRTIYLLASNSPGPAGTTEVALLRNRGWLGDEGGARRLARSGGFALIDGHSDSAWLQRSMPLVSLANTLAPGCQVIPVGVSEPEHARRLGTLLGSEADSVVVAASCLTHYGEPFGFAPAGLGSGAAAWIRANDSRMVGLLIDLDAKRIFDEAESHRNSNAAAALTAAVLAARHLGATLGTVVEYSNSGTEGESSLVDGSIGLVGALFGARSTGPHPIQT